MTRLGSTFVSEDPDSRGQVGPAGNDSTVPGPAGEDSTVPGPAGTNGVVDSIVAGANVTVDNTDPANPVVAATASGGETNTGSNLGGGSEVFKQKNGVDFEHRTLVAGANITLNQSATEIEIVAAAAGSDPLTTKGDVFGFDTDAARIPVGANDEVLTADSTKALGVKWAAPAAGGGGAQIKYMFRDNDPVLVGSGSTSAMKLQWFTCDTNITVSTVLVGIQAEASQTYQVFIVEEDGVTTKEVAALIATSLTLTNIAVSDTKMTVWEFEFTSDFNLVAGTSYALCVTLTSATTTTPARISFDTGGGAAASRDITRGDVSHIPRNTAPTVGLDMNVNILSPFVVICGLRYART